MSTTLSNTLRILADGQFHSGESIAAAAGISRAAVWKQVHSLKAMGVDVHAVSGKGYRLPGPLELLEEERIRAGLTDQGASCLRGMEIRLQTGSTNDDARQLAHQGDANLYLAEIQCAGRGRQGKRWHSGFGQSLCLSMVWRFDLVAAALNGLSLCVGLAVVRALNETGVRDVSLKWPNDIFWRGRKLGGVLIELVGELSGKVTTVIGLGLNVDLNEPDAIDQPWVDLTEILGTPPSRNQLVAYLVNALSDILPVFAQLGFGHFQYDWQQVDWLDGKKVNICAGSQIWSGVAQGVQDDGALRVIVGGQVKPVYGGEVSVRLSV